MMWDTLYSVQCKVYSVHTVMIDNLKLFNFNIGIVIKN